MKLSDIEFIRLIPQFMRDDPAVKGLAAGIDKIIPGLHAAIKMLPTWDSIDQLSSAELDELADELNILWYETTAPIETKRSLILESDKVYAHLGTKWAVEKVIRSYFGDGSIEEWFEYDGEPGHFRVLSSNPSLNNEKLTEFLNLLEKVKRASAKLDGISITLDAELVLAAGVALHEVSKEQYAIGAALPV
jgi:phage tail P2-like protein